MNRWKIRRNEWKTNSKILDLSPLISVITIIINGPNTELKD